MALVSHMGLRNLILNQINYTTFETVLNIAQIFTLVIIYFTLILQNIQGPKASANFIALLATSEDKYFAGVKQKRGVTDYVRYVAAHTLWPFFSGIHLMLWSDISLYSSVLVFIPQHLGLFYETFMVFFVWEICLVLESRYRYVRVSLKRLLNNNVIASLTLSRKLRELKDLYKVLYTEVQDLNNIFGALLLLILLHLIQLVLLNFYWIIFLMPESRYVGKIVDLFFPTAILVSATNVIGDCNFNISNFLIKLWSKKYEA